MDKEITLLQNGQAANLGPYYTVAEIKAVLADIQKVVPTAWLTRSPSTNNWIVHPPKESQ